jgi:hypothetical protein
MGEGKASYLRGQIPDLPKGVKWVQWLVENPDELAVFLEDFVVRMRRAPGDLMLVQAPSVNGARQWSLTLYPGDCLVRLPATDDRGDQLGVIRSKLARDFAESETPELIIPRH